MVALRWLGILGLWGASMPLFGQGEGQWRVMVYADAQGGTVVAPQWLPAKAAPQGPMAEDWANDGWFTDGLAERYRWYALLLEKRGRLHADPEAAREERPREDRVVRPPHWRPRSAAGKASKARRRQPLDYVVERAGIDVTMTFEVWHGPFR